MSARVRYLARRPLRGDLTIAVAALLAVWLLMLVDHVEVTSHRELRRLAFGTPLGWVSQDQRIDPPLPYRVSVSSPLESPTSVHLLPMLVDVALVGVALAALLILVRALRRTRVPA